MLLHSQRPTKFKFEKEPEGGFQILLIHNNLYCMQEDWKCDKIFIIFQTVCESVVMSWCECLGCCFFTLVKIVTCWQLRWRARPESSCCQSCASGGWSLHRLLLAGFPSAQWPWAGNRYGDWAQHSWPTIGQNKTEHYQYLPRACHLKKWEWTIEKY